MTVFLLQEEFAVVRRLRNKNSINQIYRKVEQCLNLFCFLSAHFFDPFQQKNRTNKPLR